NLAVIPSQYVHAPANPPTPSPAPAALPAANHPAVKASPSSPSSAFPQLDLSFLDALATPHSQLLTTSPQLASATSAPAEAANAATSVQQASHEGRESPDDRTQRLEK